MAEGISMATLCGAHARSTGKPCIQPVSPGSNRCRFHGGKAPKGIASPHYQGKGYSKHLPMRLREAYAIVRDDPGILEFNESIALVESRVVDLLSRVDTGESGQIWKELRDAWRAFTQSGDDNEARKDAIRTLGVLIQRGHADAAIWGDLITTIENSRRLKDSERKRRMDAHTTVTAEQAMGFATALAEVVRKYVRDPAVLQAITNDWAALTSGARALT